jgi:hypothetical protein
MGNITCDNEGCMSECARFWSFMVKLTKLLILRYKDMKQCAEYTNRQNGNCEMMCVCGLLWWLFR